MNLPLRNSLRLLALLPFLLTLGGCLHPSIAGSEALTDRPTLPTRNPELTKTERLTPIGHPETGVMGLVDLGWLETVMDRLAEATSAVTRGNNRAGGNKLTDRCIQVLFETSILPKDCPGTDAPLAKGAVR